MKPVVLIIALVLSAPANAHHAAALYDNGNLKTVAGTVIRLAFRSPHAELYVRDAKGQRWTISLESPEVARQEGKRRVMMGLLPGISVEVLGWPHRLKTRELRSHKLTFSDGTVLEGPANTLHEPQTQKTLKRLLKNKRWLAVQEAGPPPRNGDGVRRWATTNEPLNRLALELHLRRAFFIGLKEADGDHFPGIQTHLQCLPERLPSQTFDSLAEDPAVVEYVAKHNQYLARYLEGQLETCGD